MVLRILLRYLANNEQLVNRLANLKPVRRAAQIVVSILHRTSAFSGSHQLPSNSKEFGQQMFAAAKKFSANFKKELKDAQEEIKRKNQK